MSPCPHGGDHGKCLCSRDERLEAFLGLGDEFSVSHAPAFPQFELWRNTWRMPRVNNVHEVTVQFGCGCTLVMHEGDDPIREWGPCKHGTHIKTAR